METRKSFRYQPRLDDIAHLMANQIVLISIKDNIRHIMKHSEAWPEMRLGLKACEDGNPPAEVLEKVAGVAEAWLETYEMLFHNIHNEVEKLSPLLRPTFIRAIQDAKLDVRCLQTGLNEMRRNAVCQKKSFRN